jgi:hypothetical protein
VSRKRQPSPHADRFPQVTDFKQFPAIHCLTLQNAETYTESMTRSSVRASAFLVVALSTTSLVGLKGQERQRSMYVSVLDEAGAPVPDLGPADFVVREDNVAREVLRVEPATDPFTLAILVDNSQAARPYIADMRIALADFVKAMTAPSDGSVIRGKNELALLTLADRPTIVTDYTVDQGQLLKGVNRIFSLNSSGTLLLDGIIEVSRGLKKREPRRPVIVGVTTEGPELSDRHFDLVLEPLRDSGAAFHAIVVGPPSPSMSDNAHYRGVVLDQGPKSTGGRRDNILTSMALDGELKQLAVELLHQYRVTYAHPESLIPPETVTVTAARPGMTARGTLIKTQKEPR